MMLHNLSSIYPLISEKLRLRKEKHCVLIIDRINGSYWEIPPNQAVIVSLLNGTLTVAKIGEIVSSIYSIPKDQAIEAVCDTITLLSDYNLVDLQNNSVPNEHFYNPQDFVFIPEKATAYPKLYYKSPITIEFSLTNACNFQCSYCYMNSRYINRRELNRRIIDFGFFREICQQARDSEVKRAFLSGGEPLLFKDISKMVELLSSYDIFPYISTNGSLVSENLIDNFSSTGLKFIQVSFDTHNPLTFDNLTGRRGAFRKVVNNLGLMTNKGMNIRVKSVVTKINWREIEELIDFCYKLGISELEIVPCLPSVGGRNSLSSLALDSDERLILKEIVEKKKEAYRGYFKIRYTDSLMKWPDMKPRGYCGGGVSSLVIFQDGKVGICDMMPDVEEFILGDLKENSLTEIWASEKAESFRDIPEHLLCEECKVCQYREECRTGCFNLSKMIYGDYFAPDPRCPIRSL